jgi:uncharacterized membrane protein
MNRNEYLKSLREYLKDVPEDEVREILLDYEEHFAIGRDKGKADEEIVAELGSPKEVAESIRQTLGKEQDISGKQPPSSGNTDGTRKLLILILLIGLNLVFVLGPFLGVVGFLFGVFAAGVGISIGGAAMLLGFPFTFLIPGFQPGIVTVIAFGIGLIALGVLLVILGIALSKLLYRLTSSYIAWNRRLVNGQEV